ncbi:hypothetical protein USDA257_c52930 [Sinorhizobium fredii USDA 257]|uniref:Uncharacterized protein n=1 Tax=Sinorhizobium fredii (strain USDA 257) TaxID=1185652 RepID=I3XD61_SINF2|nr:hypothetical protein USDA257_c52930 [Sinorhizobium fredii USDA 257]
MAIDQIACDGRYSRATWREAKEQANSVRYRVEYWVGDIVRL